RKNIYVNYRGNNNIKDATLNEALTLSQEGAYDDYELAQSAKQIRRTYQSKGYLQARVRFTRQVNPYSDRITFHVNEGPRFKIKQVLFSGNRNVSSEDLEDVIKTRTFPWLGFFGLGEGGYVTDLQLKQDADRICNFYRSRGFHETRVTGQVAPHPALLNNTGALAAAVSSNTPDSNAAYVQFEIQEGPGLKIHKIFIQPAVFAPPIPLSENSAPSSSEPLDEPTSQPTEEPGEISSELEAIDDLRPESELAFDKQQLLSLLQLKEGIPFDPAKLGDDKATLVRFYAERGYPYATINNLEQITGDGVTIILTVDEGKKVQFGPIFVRGNFLTKENTILACLDFEPGNLFDIRLREQAEQCLRSLKIFNGVRIQLLGAADEPKEIPVLVRVEERHDNWGIVEVGAGASTDNTFFGSLGYEWHNLAGLGHNTEIKGEVGLELQSGNLRYQIPMLFGTSTILDLEGFVRNEATERLGDLFTYGLRTSFGFEKYLSNIVPNLKPLLYYDLRRIRRQEDLYRPTTSVDEAQKTDIKTTIAGFGLALVYDNLDNPFNPSRGLRIAGSMFGASRYFAGDDDFLKFNVNTQVYFPLPLGIVISLRGRYDHGVPLGGTVMLPKVERFFAGGDTTIRGFEEDRAFVNRIVTQLAPLDGVYYYTLVPQGGNIRILTTAELRFPIWEKSILFDFPILGAVFFDNGVVFNSFGQVDWKDFRHSIGWALRVVLPVGATSFEIAVPLDPDVGDPDWRFHFNFGVSF
ncbi:MAG: BamA/TamA family outer membrane protein, partial [Pseudomonadota bacterium]